MVLRGRNAILPYILKFSSIGWPFYNVCRSIYSDIALWDKQANLSSDLFFSDMQNAICTSCMSLFLPKRCMVPGVIFFPILGETGYFLSVPLRNTSSGQLSHRAFPWCNRRSILTSASCKIRVMECSLLAKAWQSGDFSTRDSLKFQLYNTISASSIRG